MTLNEFAHRRRRHRKILQTLAERRFTASLAATAPAETGDEPAPESTEDG